MNTIDLLEELSSLVSERYPVLDSYFNKGLSRDEVLRKMKKYKMSVPFEPLVTLYTWRNGVELQRKPDLLKNGSPHLSRTCEGFLYGNIVREIFQMVDLDYGFSGYKGFIEGDKETQKAANRMFPFLNDFRGRRFLLDTNADSEYMVKYMDVSLEKPIRDAYKSLDDFLLAVIKSHLELKVIDYDLFKVSIL